MQVFKIFLTISLISLATSSPSVTETRFLPLLKNLAISKPLSVNLKDRSQTSENTTIDFLLGLFVEIDDEGYWIDHDELTPYLTPNESLESVTKEFIQAALDFSKDTSLFDRFDHEIVSRIPKFIKELLANVDEKTQKRPLEITKLNMWFGHVLRDLVPLLNSNWEWYSWNVKQFFETLATSIEKGDYKYAFIQAITICQDPERVITK